MEALALPPSADGGVPASTLQDDLWALYEANGSYARLGKVLGVSDVTALRWCRGEGAPDGPLRERIVSVAQALRQQQVMRRESTLGLDAAIEAVQLCSVIEQCESIDEARMRAREIRKRMGQRYIRPLKELIA